MPRLRSAEAGERLGTLYRQQICAIFFLFSVLGAEIILSFVHSWPSLLPPEEIVYYHYLGCFYMLVVSLQNSTHSHSLLFCFDHLSSCYLLFCKINK